MIKLISTPDIATLQELQATLENNGIEAVIEESNSTIIDASGNIITYSILVNDRDESKARKIYNSLNRVVESRDVMWCPECGSDDLSKKEIRHKHSSITFLIFAPILIACGILLPLGSIISWLFIIGGLLFIIQYFRGYTEEIYHCNKCGDNFHRY